MSERFTALQAKHIEFIQQQHLFFTGTAAAEGLVNVSPKGMDSLRIEDNNSVLWLNLTGSGNESAAHILENPRMTVMFCSFDRQPLILRLYGQARAVHPWDEAWPDLVGRFPAHPGARQVFVLDIDMVQTSCGYAVPHYTYGNERKTLTKWAKKHGEDGIRAYWEEHNQQSLDDKQTGIFQGS
jgi:hypothetical protein